MIKAYHTVLGGPENVRRILEEGVIRPASERMDPVKARTLCDDLVTQITWGSSKTIPEAVEAFMELLDHRLQDLRPMPPYTTRTEFQCDDLIAGDLDQIFLSLGSWLPQGHFPGERNGFAFDAEYLIEDGAAIRPGDLVEEYDGEITDFLWHRGGKKTAEALARRLEDVKERYELRGKKALQALQKGRFQPGYAELVYPDRIMTWQAVEAWMDGRPVPVVAA
jgi:hypothetical protein